MEKPQALRRIASAMEDIFHIRTAFTEGTVRDRLHEAEDRLHDALQELLKPPTIVPAPRPLDGDTRF